MAMLIFWQAMAINHPPHSHPPAEEKDFAFEAACSGLIEDLERLAKQPAPMMKREHSQITTVKKFFSKILKLQLLEVDTRTGFEPQTYYDFIAPASRRVSNYATGSNFNLKSILN